MRMVRVVRNHLTTAGAGSRGIRQTGRLSSARRALLLRVVWIYQEENAGYTLHLLSSGSRMVPCYQMHDDGANHLSLSRRSRFVFVLFVGEDDDAPDTCRLVCGAAHGGS